MNIEPNKKCVSNLHLRHTFLSFDLKAIMTLWTVHKVLSFRFWKTQYRFAFFAFAVYVRLSVTEFISFESEKSAKFIVFATSCIDVS